MILIIMGQRGKVTDVSGQASCEICGLTARTKDEMKNILVTHGTKAESFIRTEVDPFPKHIEKISTTGEKEEQHD
jgi:hypothetical protein